MPERPSPSRGPARRGDLTHPPGTSRRVPRSRPASRRSSCPTTTTSPASDRGRRSATALSPARSAATGRGPAAAALPLSVWLLKSTTAQECSAEIRARALAAFAPPLTVRAPSQGTTAPQANPAPWPRAATAELDPAPGPPARPGRDGGSGPLTTDEDAGPESFVPAVVTGASAPEVTSLGGARREGVGQSGEADAAPPVCEVQVPATSTPTTAESDVAAVLDFVLIVATYPQRAIAAVDLGAAAARLRPGGILVVVTDRHRDGSRLVDARPGVVVTAQRAGLDYLQHIVTVLPPGPWRALGPDVWVFRRSAPPHSTRTSSDPAPADTAPMAAAEVLS